MYGTLNLHFHVSSEEKVQFVLGANLVFLIFNLMQHKYTLLQAGAVPGFSEKHMVNQLS